MTVHPFRDFGLVGREIAAAASIADLPRADSKGAAFGESALLWGRHLAKIRGDARDPARHGLAAQLAAAAFRAQYAPDHRADAASFFANDLVDRDSTITIRPQRPNAVLGAVPVDNVQPWMESWTAKFGEDAGVAAPYRKGSTDTRLVNGSVTEEIRPMMMFRIDARENFGDAQQAAISGVDFNSQAEDTRRALEAHAKAHNAGLVSGVAGFAGYHLGNLPGVLRVASTTEYGTTAVDTALPEFRRILLQIPTDGDSTFPSPDTILITQRMLNQIGGYLAFAQGGTEFSDRLLRELFSSNGISRVVVCNELKNLNANGAVTAGTDMVVLFNSASPDSLRQKVGLRPAPVKTFDVELDRQTAFLSGFGGLYAKLGGSVLIYSARVTL